MGDVPPPDHHKTSWPEVVGWPEMRAGFKIVYDRPDVTVIFLDVSQDPPPGHNRERVVVFVDGNLLVAQTPVIG